MSSSISFEDEYEEWCREQEAEALADLQANDPVHRDIRYHYFVSKSKGRRNGKQRRRRNWKEVELISYRGGSFHQWNRFPFDVYATECLGQEVSADDACQEFMDRIRRMGGWLV